MRWKLSIVLLLCQALPLLSQKNFLPAHLIDMEGNTFVGEIDYREWNINPSSIEFREDALSEGRELGVKDIRQFSIDANQELYERAVVNLNVESVEFGYQPIFQNYNTIDSKIEKILTVVFLRVLIKGKLNLYQYIDINKRVHYFIQKGDGPIHELTYREVHLLERAPVLKQGEARSETDYNGVIFQTYKQELAQLMGDDCPAATRTLGQLRYSNLILSVVKKYNNCMGGSTYIRSGDKVFWSLFLQAGFQSSSTNISGKSVPVTPNMPVDLTPYYGFGFEVSIPRTRKKANVGLELAFLNNEAFSATQFNNRYGDPRHLEYDLSLKGIRGVFFGKYVLYHGKYIPYVKAGAGFIKYNKRNYAITEIEASGNERSDHELREAEFVALFSAGVLYRRFFLEARLESGTDIDPTTGYNLKVNRLALLVGYRFGKH
ncbi:MAG: hypothetical protein R2824_00700 [Saprospiraceae bacterium]|nr:hypothetical protein [Lewinella sp.]